MKGKIRPHHHFSRCPNCKQKFQEIKKIGYACPKCMTTPRRFYVDLNWRGKRVRIFSDKSGNPLSSYDQALSILFKINQEILDFSFDPTKYVKSEQQKFYFKNLFEQWKSSKSDKWSFKYQKQVKFAEKYIFSFFNSTDDVREIKGFDIHNFLNTLKHLSPKSQYNILGILKSFINYLRKIEIIDNIPFFPTISVPEPAWKWLTEEQQEQIFKFIPVEDRYIFIFMALHGTRPGEARALKIQDIDFDLQAVIIKRSFSGHILSTTKNKRIRTIPIHPLFLSTLKELCKDKLPEVFVFTYSKTGKPYSETVLRRIWKSATQKAGINIKMYEGLRHSWASQRITSVPLYLISKMLGHSDTRITKRYAHADLEALRACVNTSEKTKIINLNKK